MFTIKNKKPGVFQVYRDGWPVLTTETRKRAEAYVAAQEAAEEGEEPTYDYDPAERYAERQNDRFAQQD